VPTIIICGDPHGQFSHISRAVLAERPAAVILLGDMDASRPLDEALAPIAAVTDIFWIHGNHDTESETAYDSLFGSRLADHCLHGKVVDVHGRRFAGIGGVFRSKIWNGATAAFQTPADYLAVCGKGNFWRGGLPLKHRSTLFPSDLAAFAGEHADVLVSHEAPGAHPYGFSALTDLAARLQVKDAFHGHHHETIAYPDGVWHGVGLHEVFRYSW
jgi:Icc-related predicted phosphoesterase